MKTYNLKKIEHNYRIGHKPPNKEPNLIESGYIAENDKLLGFYINQLPKRLINLIEIANVELNSSNVPKSIMKRSSSLITGRTVDQYSCIIGSIPPKPHMKRSYATRSSVHLKKSAETFVKAMSLAGLECIKLMQDIVPDLYEKHKTEVYKKVPEKWRFADIYTSSISNYNISAPIHQDRLNVKNSLNCIITKKHNAKGGDLYLPDYDITVNSANNSLLVYPAWRNMHGVTEIKTTHDNGYRNSLIWYALDAFKGDYSE